MIQATVIIGAVLSAVVILVGVILAKVTPSKSYVAYVPGALFFVSGLILLLCAILFDKIYPFGYEAALGGWGIACVFAAAIGLIVVSVADSFGQQRA